MQFLTFVSKTALRRITATATPFGSVVAVANLAALKTCMRSHAESCIIVDPALLSVVEADEVAKVAAELLRPVVAYTSLTQSAMQSAVVLALQAHAQFVYQGTPDERGALTRVLVAIPGPELGGALVAALSPRLDHLTPPLREVVLSILRTGSGPLSSAGLALRSGVPRRTMDRSIVSAGFKSTRLLIAAAKIVRSYRAITTTSTSFKRIAAALGYASQRTLDRQCRLLLGTSIANLRQTPIPVPETVDVLASRIVRRSDCRVPVERYEPDNPQSRKLRERDSTQQAAPAKVVRASSMKSVVLRVIAP